MREQRGITGEQEKAKMEQQASKGEHLGSIRE